MKSQDIHFIKYLCIMLMISQFVGTWMEDHVRKHEPVIKSYTCFSFFCYFFSDISCPTSKSLSLFSEHLISYQGFPSGLQKRLINKKKVGKSILIIHKCRFRNSVWSSLKSHAVFL